MAKKKVRTRLSDDQKISLINWWNRQESDIPRGDLAEKATRELGFDVTAFRSVEYGVYQTTLGTDGDEEEDGANDSASQMMRTIVGHIVQWAKTNDPDLLDHIIIKVLGAKKDVLDDK